MKSCHEGLSNVSEDTISDFPILRRLSTLPLALGLRPYGMQISWPFLKNHVDGLISASQSSVSISECIDRYGVIAVQYEYGQVLDKVLD